ncbi:MAG: hypothetical protein AB7O21_21185 [Gammaproteobacteria bacterium]
MRCAALLLMGLCILPGAARAADRPDAPMPAAMKVITFFATPEGGSRFGEVEIPFALQRDDGLGHVLHLSTAYGSPAVQFVDLPAGMNQDWHTAPARQIVVVLAGTLEVETTDGETRRWRTGDVFLPADVTGKGHRTRCIDGAVRVMFAPLPDGFDATTWTTP